MKTRWHHAVFGLAVVTALIPVWAVFYVLLSVLAFDYPSTTAVVNARTQILSYKLEPQRPYVWRLPAGTYAWVSEELDGDGRRETYSESAITVQQLPSCSRDGRVECSEGEYSGIRMVQSLSDNGHLMASWIFGSTDEHFSSTTLHSNETTTISSALRIDFESAYPLGPYQTSHLVRNVELGALLAPATIERASSSRQATLLGGEISFFAKTLDGQNRYLVESATLSQGDWVIFATDDDRELSSWVQVTYFPDGGSGEAPALKALVRAATDQIQVTQNQAGSGFLVGIGEFTILASEPLVTTLWGGLLFLLVLLGTAPDLHAYLVGESDEVTPAKKPTVSDSHSPKKAS